MPQDAQHEGTLDARVSDHIEFLARCLVREYELAELGAVDLTVLIEVLGSKPMDNLVVCRGALESVKLHRL